MDSQRKNIDKYTFLYSDKIGEGSFGKVYKGKDTKTKQIVAIKMLNKNIINKDEYLLQGLHNQIDVMMKLKSPFIVNLYDVLETTNNYYIIQEYCDGGDLRQLMKKNKVIPQQVAVCILTDLLHGFLQLIKHGIIHRDLKPENILIHEGRYKLADFGFARSVDNFKKDLLKSMVGTPLYMSPQILKHEKYTTKCDIWSIGIIYFEMMTGKTPWPEARSQFELIQLIEEQPIQFSQKFEISVESKDFIWKCLRIQEIERIDWDTIYRHALLQEFFAEHLSRKEQLEDKANFLINELRRKINSSQMDLMEVFEKYDTSKDQMLEMKEFRELMREIDKNLTNEECEYLFNQFDADSNGTIQFGQFQRFLEANNVRMSTQESSQKQDLLKIQQNVISDSGDVEPLVTKFSEKRAKQAIKSLQYSITYYQLDLNDVFQHYDQHQQGSINFEQFTNLIKQIDRELNDEDIQATFVMFDQDCSGEISFHQFSSLLNNTSPNSEENGRSNNNYQQFQPGGGQ